MDVKKIFIVLITIVGCVIIGSFILNIILPNTAAAISNSIEDMIFNTTGISMDFNGDGIRGSKKGNNEANYNPVQNQDSSKVQGNVSGFGGNQKGTGN